MQSASIYPQTRRELWALIACGAGLLLMMSGILGAFGGIVLSMLDTLAGNGSNRAFAVLMFSLLAAFVGAFVFLFADHIEV